MAIQHPVAPGTLLLCDYSLGGFREPEMVKRRPAIVISPRLPYRDRLCTVIPLSSSPGARELDYIVRLEMARPLPEPFDYAVVWAKCDMMATVSFERLDLFRTSRDHTGKRQYLQVKLPVADLQRVRRGVLSALGITAFPP